MSPEPWEYDRVEAEALRCRREFQDRLGEKGETLQDGDDATLSAVITVVIIVLCAVAGFLATTAIAV